MTINIKRENWKGKFKVVARQNGKILSHANWKRSFTLKQASRIFKKNRTFNKDIKVSTLTNFNEVSNFSKNQRITGADKYQVIARAKFRDRVIVARSSQRPLDFPKSELKNEAIENLHLKLSQEFNLPYDEDEGMKIIDEKKPRIDFGVVYYRNRTQTMAASQSD